MKVLHIITGLGDGGAEATLFRLCLSDKSNHHTVISLTGAGKYSALLIENNIDVVLFSLLRKNLLLELKMLYLYVKGNDADVVQTWMYHADLIGGIISRLCGKKRVFWGVHNTILERNKSKFTTRLISKVCCVFSYFIPEKIIYCANESKLVHENMGYSVIKSLVIFNGYDLDKFKQQELRHDFDLKNSTNIKLGMVGRYDAYKDHVNLIKALKLVKTKKKKFTCYLVGSGLDNSNVELTDLIHLNNLNEEIILLNCRNDIDLFMNYIDIHILSSSAEAFPNVLCEAMACGTPCVSTLVGDAEIILGGNGWLCEPKDSFQLSQKILEAIVEYEEDSKGFNARCLLARKHIIDNFSLHTMLQKYNEVWKSFISS